jgi:hypothetical protein
VNFIDRFSKNPQILIFMKICYMGAELFYLLGQSDGNEEANSYFPELGQHA